MSESIHQQQPLHSQRPSTPADLAALSDQLSSLTDEDIERFVSAASTAAQQQSLPVAVPTTAHHKRSILRSTMSYLRRGGAAPQQQQPKSDNLSLPAPATQDSPTLAESSSSFLDESLPQIALSAEGGDMLASMYDSAGVAPQEQNMSKRMSVMANRFRTSLFGGMNGNLVLGGVVVDDKVRKEVGELFLDLDIDLRQKMLGLFRKSNTTQPEPSSLQDLSDLIESLPSHSDSASTSTSTDINDISIDTTTPFTSNLNQELDLSVRLYAETHKLNAEERNSGSQITKLMRGLRKSVSLVTMGAISSSGNLKMEGIDVDAAATKKELDKVFDGMDFDMKGV
ncbi:hypothetical protein BJ741DRAFT_578814 [Chytriomyces cf. hyalinus JEL632]|nr:hypothetical protein BJ741DRAFT_578814 [Chytriomyces cf. hyalinus JEL632]